MPKKRAACAALFMAIAGAHVFWIAGRAASASAGCSSAPADASSAPSVYGGAWTPPPAPSACATAPSAKGLSGYFHEQDYFLGLSYGLSGAFALYALCGFVERRRVAAAAGAAGGLTLAGFVSAGGCGLCFASGCCGAPTLPIVASFIGGAFLSLVKPLAFGVTLISVALGVWWLKRTSRPAPVSCACGDGCCDS